MCLPTQHDIMEVVATYQILSSCCGNNISTSMVFSLVLVFKYDLAADNLFRKVVILIVIVGVDRDKQQPKYASTSSRMAKASSKVRTVKSVVESGKRGSLCEYQEYPFRMKSKPLARAPFHLRKKTKYHHYLDL